MRDDARPARDLARRRVRHIAPFAGALLVAFGLGALPPHGNDLTLIAIAAVLAALLLAISIITPWQRLPQAAEIAPALAFLPVIALLRHFEGGAASGYSALVLLPVIWLALYSTREAVLVSLVAVAATMTTPILLVGSPEYPSTEWRRTCIVLTVAAVAGFTVRRLIARVRTLSERLTQLALTDALTGLPNRRVWDEQLPRELARAARERYPLSIAVIDIDKLKAINDRHGHPAGDALLQDCGRLWQLEVRDADLLVRLGGDEFALLLPGCSAATADRVVERVVAAGPAGAGASCGVAQWDGSEDAATLVARADEAMYARKARRAKQPGKRRRLTAV